VRALPYGTIKIVHNNIINNVVQATDSFGIRCHWSENYWDNWEIRLPKPIFGRFSYLVFFPHINFDWHPAQKPIDIPVP
jgi:hypothetical protein